MFQQLSCNNLAPPPSNGVVTIHVMKYTRECTALWGEPERATEVCCRLSSTVENGAVSLIFQRMRSFARCQDLVIGERFEMYVQA